MVLPFNGLSPAEAERLALLIEECGEVIQAATKVLRHGYESYHPDDMVPVISDGGLAAYSLTDLEPKPGAESNRDALTRELADLFAVYEMMDADFARIDAAEQEKAFERKMKYTHHQDDD